MDAVISPSDFALVLLVTVLVVGPVAAIMFARSGESLRSLGKGPWAIHRDRESDSTPPGGGAQMDETAVEEVRQMVTAADYRRRVRGEDGLVIEEEVARLTASVSGPGASVETSIRVEVRQLVIANNERRARRGEEPLDVEAEVDRRLAEWG